IDLIPDDDAFVLEDLRRSRSGKLRRPRLDRPVRARRRPPALHRIADPSEQKTQQDSGNHAKQRPTNAAVSVNHHLNSPQGLVITPVRENLSFTGPKQSSANPRASPV